MYKWQTIFSPHIYINSSTWTSICSASTVVFKIGLHEMQRPQKMQHHVFLRKKTMLQEQILSDQCDSYFDSSIYSEPLILGHICCNGTATTVLYFFSKLVGVHDLGLYGLLTLQRWHQSGVVKIHKLVDKLDWLCPSVGLVLLNFLVFVRYHCPEPGSWDCQGLVI